VNARRVEEIARRQELLEIEAEVQRLTLAATLSHYEHMRVLSWASSAARIALRVFAAAPRMRLLLLMTLWRRFGRRRR
jgi:hypothetical protein